MRLNGYIGRHGVSAAYSFNTKTNKLYQMLTAGYGLYTGQSSLGRVVGISPDKQYAYMPAWKDRNTYSLLKVNLTKKRKPSTHRKGTSDTVDFFVDRNGEVLARERFSNKKNRHLLQAWHDGRWKDIYEEETEIRHVSFNGVTPDGKSLVMIKQSRDHGRWAYHTISLADGTISEAIFSKKDRDVESVITDINRVVYGVRYSGFKPTYEFFDEKLNQRFRGISEVLPDNAMTVVDYTQDWSTILFYMTGADSSGNYIRYKGGKLDFIGAARSAITSDMVNPVSITEYKARDNLTIPTLLTLPKGKEAKNLPAIMLPHGGPESYDKLDFDWLSQYFASQGYAVIQPQFRGSEGFGVRHQFAGRGEWGRKMQDDLTDGVATYAKQGIIDPSRVCIVGASYGGYAALAGATFTPELYKCVVSINGVSDIEQMMKLDRRKLGRNHWVVAYWDKVISNGSVEEDHLEKISPINSVEKIVAPVLLVHSEHDLIVNVRQSRAMYDEMKDANKSVKFVELEDGNHKLSSAVNRAKALEEIATFVNKHI